MKLLTLLATALLAMPVVADDHSDAKAEVKAAAMAFNDAYTSNDIDTYFGLYADDAEVYWFGERVDMAAYHADWTALIGGGGGVVTNDISDLKIQMMPGNNVAVVTMFIYNETRSPDGDVESARAYETDVWRKSDGAWKIVSLHFSVIPPAE